MSMLDELLRVKESPDEKGKSLGGFLGAILGAFGLKLKDVENFSVKPTQAMVTTDVDAFQLMRKTKLGGAVEQAHGDIKQAASSLRIESAGDGFEGAGLPPKSRLRRWTEAVAISAP